MTWEISITCARMYFESNIPYEAVLVSPVPIMYTFVSSVSIGYWWAQYPYKLVSSILIYWWAKYQWILVSPESLYNGEPSINMDTGELSIFIYWWAQYPYILVSGEPNILIYWWAQNPYILVTGEPFINWIQWAQYPYILVSPVSLHTGVPRIII